MSVSSGSGSCPQRSRVEVTVTPASPPAPKRRRGAATKRGAASKVYGDKYPGEPPALPLRGSPGASLRDLQHWRAEIFAAEGEHITAVSSSVAAGFAAQAATEALRCAEAMECLVEKRVNVASERLETAWDNYIKLYGLAVTSPHGSSPPPADGLGDKGKGRAPVPVGDDVDDGEEEVVSRELEESGSDAEDPAGEMDMS